MHTRELSLRLFIIAIFCSPLQAQIEGPSPFSHLPHENDSPADSHSHSYEVWNPGLDVFRKAPYLVFPGRDTEMQALWQLDSSYPSLIEWGLDTLYTSGSEVTYQYGEDYQHSFMFTDLLPATCYYYRVTAGDAEYRGSFRSAPAGTQRSIKFVAYGDSRSYPAIHDSVAAGILALSLQEPEFQTILLSMGDLVYDGDSESDWDTELFDPAYPHIQAVLRGAPYQATMGNHERTGILFGKYFPYPFVDARYWSFDYGPAHFVIVDQYTAGPEQLAWIEGDLASTRKPWKFICLHEPGWSAGGHANDEDVQLFLQPLCEEYGVSIVFAGHNHYYARAVVNGVHHVTTGGGGAPLYTPDPGYPYIVATSRSYHFCAVEIEGSILEFTALRPDGEIIDAFSIDTGPIFRGGRGYREPIGFSRSAPATGAPRRR